MKFSKAWVDQWVNNSLTADEMSDLITMAGLEVDSTEAVCADFNNVVVGHVVECEDHPDSDHLHVTKVDVGEGDLLQIVCGAANCRKGLKVACSKVGAKLPGITIKAAKLRGVDSQGMLCSYKELGMAEESDGIIELLEDAPVGMDLHEYMHLDDATIDVDLTTNRPDCLSIRGIAREVAVLTKSKFHDKALDYSVVEPNCNDRFAVEIEDFESCPRYLGRVVRNVNQKAPTPLWMSEALRRCGVRSVSPIVDVTNYVMLELGQPLHSFDFNRLSGKVIVRKAKAGEVLELLSGESAKLNENTLIIADENGPLALAGIFGGANSGINDETTDVFLESAFFAPLAIKGRARQYGLKTDASHRFERGVDPQLQRAAIERATELLVKIAGGEVGPVVECCNESVLAAHIKSEQKIELRVRKLDKVLGCEIPLADIEQILTTLGLQPKMVSGEGRDATYCCVAPSFRFDIEIEEDLIEEVARIYGYNNIPNTLPIATMLMNAKREEMLSEKALRQSLVNSGYNEAITYSFTDPKVLKAFNDLEPLVLSTPISVEMSAMRTTLLAGLCVAAKYNVNRQQKRVRLFELGLRYIQDSAAENGVAQEPMIAGVLLGDTEAESWAMPSRKVDFFDVKGDVEALLALTAHSGDFEWRETKTSFLHPGQGADLYLKGVKVGVVGMLHPQVQKELGFKTPVGVFELEQAALLQRTIPLSREISKFPSVRRDFAFVVPKEHSAAKLVEVIKAAGGDLISDITIFDVFAGEGLGENERSIALGVTLYNVDHTLEDSEVEAVVTRIVDSAKQSCGASLRS